MAVYVFTIAGATKSLQLGWSIRESANARASFTGAIVSTDASYRPALGAEVILTEDGTAIFGGYIDSPAEQGLGGEGVVGIVTTISAADYNSLAERRSVIDGGFPAGFTLKQALTSLVGWLTDYGVTLHASQVDGPTLPLLIYDVRTVQSILDELSIITGYLWRIDFDKKLRMWAPGDLAAPVSITTANRFAEGDVSPVKSRTDYANYVILLAGTGTAEVTDTFTGDGVTTTFALNYQLYADRGYVTNAAVNETLGSGATWSYNAGTNSIVRASAPANLNAISITYIAQFPVRVTADGGAAAADRVDKVFLAPDTFSRTVAQALADGYLDRAMAAESKTVRYRTRQTGIHPGQTQTITVAERNISGTHLITDVQTVNIGGNVIARDVTAVSGTTYPGSWRDAERTGVSSGTTVGGTTTIISSGVGGSGTVGALAQWVTSATLGDGPMASNVPLLNAANTFTALQAISAGASAALEVRVNNNVQLISMKNQAGAESWSWRMPAGTNLVLRDTVNGVDHLTFTQGASANATFSGLLNVTGAGTGAVITTSTGAFSSNVTGALNGSFVDGYKVTGWDALGYDNSTGLVIGGYRVSQWQTLRFYTAGTEYMTLSSVGALGHPSYVSQTSNWRITAAGEADFRYLFVDEMHAKSFIADLEQALAGGQIIAKSVAMVSQAFTAPAASGTATLWVRDLPSAANMAAFESGDSVVLRTFSRAAGALTIADCVGVVTSYTDGSGANEGQQSWTFTRGAGGSAGTMSSSTVVAVDSIVIDYGVPGNGYYEVNAIDGTYGVNSPYAQIVTWTTAPVAANRQVRARYGNLKGITSVLEYGLWAGKSLANNQYLLASDTNFELRGIDLKLYDGATNTVRIDPSVPSFALGATLPTAYGTGTGIWMGKDSSTYKFRVGNPAGDRVTWDGTALAVVGTLTATSGTIGSFTIGGTTLDSGSVLLNGAGQVVVGGTSSSDSLWISTTGGAPHRIWIGNSTASVDLWWVNGDGAMFVAAQARFGASAYLNLAERSTTPTSPTAGSEVNIYMKADKLIVQYNLGGTAQYFWLDLTSGSGTWSFSTSAP